MKSIIHPLNQITIKHFIEFNILSYYKNNFKMKQIKYNSTDVLGYNIFSASLENIKSTKKVVINTINQYSYCLAEKDKSFKKALMDSDILLPDGIGIVAASRFITKKKINRITGADLHKYLLEKANKNNWRCFYLGSTNQTLEKIRKRCNEEYPNIIINTFSPPFKPDFAEEDNQKMIERINEFSPDVLFIGMTAPKQEKWAISYKDFVEAKAICSIGAVFDFYAGTVERPRKLWRDLGLEWFGRLLKEPRRMWKRYLYYGPLFIYHIIMKITIIDRYIFRSRSTFT
jgi:N-acetylglucosaminyldiphosphoundecaprenol N-acetyl-beta-D-mannosaminyltransferase